MDLSIIIVNYNTSNLIQDCVHSIFEHTDDNLLFEIIVVDNASKEAELNKLKNIEGIKLIEAGSNVGFGRGNNIGVKHAIGEFIILLNSDTILFENSLNIMMNVFKKYEDDFHMGALGCELVDTNYNPNGSSYKFTSSKKIIQSNLEHLLSKFHKSSKKNLDVEPKFNENGLLEVDYIIGADLLMRRSLYNTIGGFDEDYFMYFEEADLQLKIKKLGLRRLITNQTQIIHIGGGSTGSETKLNNNRRILIQKGRNLYLKKNDPKNYTFYVIYDFLYGLFRLFNRNYTLKENLKFLLESIKSY